VVELPGPQPSSEVHVGIAPTVEALAELEPPWLRKNHTRAPITSTTIATMIRILLIVDVRGRSETGPIEAIAVVVAGVVREPHPRS
jgi:hypothetical protein